MSGPKLVLVWELGDGSSIPGFGGGIAQHPRPDQGLPGQGGHPSHPIYHPGHPDHGLPAYPDQGLPGQQPGRPGQGLPPFPDQGLPPGGEEIPPDGITDPELPEGYDDQLVIGVKKPGGDDWEYKAYDPSLGIDNAPIQPTPAPKGRRG